MNYIDIFYGRPGRLHDSYCGHKVYSHLHVHHTPCRLMSTNIPKHTLDQQNMCSKYFSSIIFFYLFIFYFLFIFPPSYRINTPQQVCCITTTAARLWGPRRHLGGSSAARHFFQPRLQLGSARLCLTSPHHRRETFNLSLPCSLYFKRSIRQSKSQLPAA